MRFLGCAVLWACLAGSNISAQQNKLDTTTFVVLGEGLGAGMADFSLRDTYQKNTFGALIAQQLSTAFPQPLIELPGIGGAPGFATLEVTLPALGQTTVREIFPPQLFIFNLSVPGLKVADAINKPPVAPLIQKNNASQTVLNMIIGYPMLTLKNVPLWTQLQYAQALNPTLALVELGYYDVLDAAIHGDASLLPDPTAFQANYSKIVSTLAGIYANVIVTTIPNPLDTAYFTSLPSATRLVGATPAALQSLYGFKSDDLLTVPGLMTVGDQLTSQTVGNLPAGAVLSGSVAAQIASAVSTLNGTINSIAKQNGALVYDLNALFANVKTQGVTIGTTQLTADYLGGFYSLDGYYPGTSAHALIANGVIALLNQTFGKSFQTVDPTTFVSSDPVVRMMPAIRRKESERKSRDLPGASRTEAAK